MAVPGCHSIEELRMNFVQTVAGWIANNNDFQRQQELPAKIDWTRSVPFLLLNLSGLLVFWVGYSAVAIGVALAVFFARIFFIGGFYHRYFSHKTYQTNRFWQFIFACCAGTCVQRGPLWWAAHHRQHHMCSDEEADAHSPVQHGFWWSHVGWFMSKKYYHYNPERVRDLARYPELVFLDRYDVIMPLVLFFSMWMLGAFLHAFFPSLGTSSGQMIVWGFSLSTIALFHSTVSINSLSHVFGKRRFQTKDNSRNNVFLALLTFGEGWHNNHHHYPAAANQGFMWWEIDITFYILKAFEKLGIIWDLRTAPKSVLSKNLVD